MQTTGPNLEGQKPKERINLEAWEKEISNTVSLKNKMKREINTAQMKKQTKNTEVQINEEEISKLLEKIQNSNNRDDQKP